MTHLHMCLTSSSSFLVDVLHLLSYNCHLKPRVKVSPAMPNSRPGRPVIWWLLPHPCDTNSDHQSNGNLRSNSSEFCGFLTLLWLKTHFISTNNASVPQELGGFTDRREAWAAWPWGSPDPPMAMMDTPMFSASSSIYGVVWYWACCICAG